MLRAVPRKQLNVCEARNLFATNVRLIRGYRKLTQEQVAEAADLHPNYISSVERAERNISICNIERIARALNVPMYVLLQEKPTIEIPVTGPMGAKMPRVREE